MFLSHKSTHPIARFFILLLAACTIASVSWNEGATISSKQVMTYEEAVPLMSKNSSDGAVIDYCNRSVHQPQDVLDILLKSFMVQCLLLLCLGKVLVTPIRKFSFKLFFIRVYYFIVDLDVHILSSRAHPPTR